MFNTDDRMLRKTYLIQ